MLEEEKNKAKNQETCEIGNRAEAILQASIDGFCVLDIDGKVLEVNRAYCVISGCSKEELIGMKITDIEAFETAEQTAQHIDKIIKQGYDRFETKHRRKDSKIIDIEVSSQYCDIEKEKFIFSFFRDITERKQTQMNFELSEARFRKLSEAAFEGFAIHENRKVLDVNQKFVEMFGYTLEELGNMDGIELVAPNSRETVKRYTDSGHNGPYETIGMKKDGSMFPIEVQAREMQSQGRTFRIGAVRDLSIQKQLEIERESYKEKILRTQKHAYIASMGAIVAHQLNQPLTAINMRLGKALEMVEESNCSSKCLKNVKKSLAEAQRAASIIRKFRQCSKDPALESTGKVNVSNTANRMVSMLSEKAEQVKIGIFAKNLEQLPEVEINETALEQILYIIIQNAIDAADGRKRHKLDILGKFVDGFIELQFSDNCGGIFPNNLEKIFEPFFSTKSDGKGIGLGLDIIQQILISCGGEIRVESIFGKGATFYVTLPISNNMMDSKDNEK